MMDEPDSSWGPMSGLERSDGCHRPRTSRALWERRDALETCASGCVDKTQPRDPEGQPTANRGGGTSGLSRRKTGWEIAAGYWRGLTAGSSMASAKGARLITN